MADQIFTPTMQQQIEQLLGLQTDRAARTAPIHQAAMAMAQRMAPNYAKSAMTAPSSLPPVAGGSLMPSSSSGGGPGVGSMTAAAIAAMLIKPGSPLLAALKKLFPSGGPSPAGSGGFGAPSFSGFVGPVQGDPGSSTLTYANGPTPGQVVDPNQFGFGGIPAGAREPGTDEGSNAGYI